MTFHEAGFYWCLKDGAWDICYWSGGNGGVWKIVDSPPEYDDYFDKIREIQITRISGGDEND